MVGLSCAWFLQEAGVDVVVLDRTGVAAGASWGNAGWLSPALTVPLPEPAVLRYGLKAMADHRSPLYVPARVDPRLWRFLLEFSRHCTPRRWRSGMAAYRSLNEQALAAFDQLEAGGVRARSQPASIFAAFARDREAEGLLDELRLVAGTGQQIEIELLTGNQARERQPLLSDAVTLAVDVRSQRFINPGAYVAALADSVRARGGQIREGVTVHALRDAKPGVLVETDGAAPLHGEAAVIATGSWMPQLAAPHGVRTLVQAGRGYSFSVETDPPAEGPLYFPGARVACTPVDGRMRIAGMMEFRRADDPLDARRIGVIEAATRPLLQGVDWSSRRDEWVGPRPVTPDGLPLIGATSTKGIFVAGGHGMWGITLGPLTGRLLAHQITTGRTPVEIVPFNPLR
ncbi:D-amino acid dehydrogenase 1 [Capillimicrobium parvum]|uniref:D-amino acid dehydrogenase 1 n=2 Tax=Capillimicrobium parvum TaxID=2884022 RepID=A0A9E6XWE8_9ACTN|nr:D-amino acid dehydrogenase 1 [Capillimicrobium parvum]